MAHIGLDLGTFHTVASLFDAAQRQLVPFDSVPSVALLGTSPPIVGRAAQQTKGTPMLAPKLRLREPGEDRRFLQEVLKKLANQAIGTLYRPDGRMALTVPPGWTADECDFVARSVEDYGTPVTFIHEPAALLIAVAYVAEHHERGSPLLALLRMPSHAIVCDWGAGTVDLAVVATKWDGAYEFRCKAEKTLRGHGGTDIAREVVDYLYDEPSPDPRPNDRVRLDLILQTGWEDGFRAADILRPYVRTARIEQLDDFVANVRRRHASAVAEEIAVVWRSAGLLAGASPLILLHGGPLEAAELKETLVLSLVRHDANPDRVYSIGSEYCGQLCPGTKPWRRDSLVSVGASLFAARGEALPEYGYLISLRDAGGNRANAVRLVRGVSLSGRVAVEPPYTGQDYWAEVQQIRYDWEERTSQPTPIQKELALYVRDDALVVYEISDVGVGYARVDAYEAARTMAPRRLADAKSDSVKMPEKSTRFRIAI